MIFIDTWIWLEYLLKEEKWKTAEKIIENSKKHGILIDSIVLTEIKYSITREFSLEDADVAISGIEETENLMILPVNKEIAKYAAELRIKYRGKDKKAISLADAVHLATAALTNCSSLYTGDPDFKNIEEIKTVII